MEHEIRIASAIVTAVGLLVAAVLMVHPLGRTEGPTITYTPQYPPTERPPQAAFIGDSYTAGVGASDETKRWSTLVAEREGWTEDNRGLGGTGFVTSASESGCGVHYCETFLEVAGQMRRANPKIIVIAGGQNDLKTWVKNSAPVEQAVQQTYDRLRNEHPDATIIAVGPSDVAQTDPAVAGLDRVVRANAKRIGATYISLLDPLVIKPYMVRRDGVHVDDRGHAAIAKRVLAGIPA